MEVNKILEKLNQRCTDTLNVYKVYIAYKRRRQDYDEMNKVVDLASIYLMALLDAEILSEEEHDLLYDYIIFWEVDQLNIDILYTYKNNALIRDLKTDYLWLFSYNKPIAYYDGRKIYCGKGLKLTQSNYFHLAEMKKYIDKEQL